MEIFFHQRINHKNSSIGAGTVQSYNKNSVVNFHLNIDLNNLVLNIKYIVPSEYSVIVRE